MDRAERGRLLHYVALGSAAPATAVIYALWHGGLIHGSALTAWMAPVMAVVIFGAAGVGSNRIEDAGARRWYSAVVAGQFAGLVIALTAVAAPGEAAALWGVAVLSVVMLLAWVAAVVARGSRSKLAG